jgi:hypothetical protein
MVAARARRPGRYLPGKKKATLRRISAGPLDTSMEGVPGHAARARLVKTYADVG